MRIIVGALTFVIVAGSAFAQEPKTPPLERVWMRDITLKLPVTACTVPDLVKFAAKDLEVPAGVEYLPGQCDYKSPRPAPADEIALLGRTFDDILDLLVKADPRFYWTESDGVVVLRPLAAWRDPDHFLHRAVDRLELKEQNVGAAMDVLFPGPYGASGLGEQILATDPTLLTITVTARSLVESLEAVVREHRRARWEVGYCGPEVKPQLATVWIYTYDDRGLGRRAAFDKDPEGKIIDRCRAKK